MKKEEIVRAKMVEAMKAKDQETKTTLSLLLSALKNASIDKRRDLTEAEENEIVQKEIRQTKETLDTCPKDRVDIIQSCEKRIDVLNQFAPMLMSADEIKGMINNILSTLGFTNENPATKRDKGKIMKELMPKVKGRADGKMVNQIIDGVLI